MEIPELIRELRQHLACRRIRQGRELLEAHLPGILELSPYCRHAGTLVGLTAQWVDAGFHGTDLIRQLVERFPQPMRDTLPVGDYLHLRMAEGLLAIADEDPERAMKHFRFAVAMEGETGDTEALAIANFWMGRCLRILGRYDDSMQFAVRGRGLALACGYVPMAAVIRLLESWLVFQQGRLRDAARILQEAEAALAGTDDHVTLGNIHSAHGRIARRHGAYTEALACFERAIEEYARDDPRHRHLARSLVNMAFVERLVALEEQRQIDREAARRRSQGAGSAVDTRQQRVRVAEIRSAARGHLGRALEIYGSRAHHGGGSALINLGLLDLDDGELDSAAEHAAAAFQRAEEKRDNILMARACTLHCMIENARLEEGIGDPAGRARLALDFARAAVDYAGRTQYSHLLARARVWEGLTWTTAPLADLDAARQCCEHARRLLRTESGEHESAWEDLEELQSRVLQRGGVEPVLESWSQGVVGDKTFQQITEEFAVLLVPKVWEREGRKVSRVAQKLSMSPKKVRRILRAAGC